MLRTPREAGMATTRRTFRRLLGGASGALAARLDVPPAFAQTGRVKIGVLAPKAGVTAPVGESGLRGTQFAVDRINAAGGILGRRIELVVEEESNPKDTVERDRKSTRLNSSHVRISYAVFCLKKKKKSKQ